jgi:hypothetical protein
MGAAYKDMPSYGQYLNIDSVTGLGERLDNLMPHLQYNEVRNPNSLLAQKMHVLWN